MTYWPARQCRAQATLWALSASLGLLFACTVCGAGRTQVATPTNRADDSPCGDEATLSSLDACVPNAWYCGPRFFAAGRADGCDCDCGVVDPDCGLGGVDHWCYNVGRPRKVASCDACSAVGEPDLL